jgi:hypothetical protein
VIGAVGVVAILILSLLLTGIIPGLKQAGTAVPSAYLSYDSARPLADAAAAGAPHGPWTFFDDRAYDMHYSLPLDRVLGDYLVAPYNISYLTPLRPGLPAFNGSYVSGVSPFWFFVYTNGTVNGPPYNALHLLAVIVENGTASAVATMWGAYWTHAIPTVGSPVLDSPAAMAVAIASNASFIDSHPDLNVTFGVAYFSSPLMVGWYWGVGFSTCSPLVHSGTEYGGWINATTGVLYDNPQPINMSCGPI